MLGLKCAFGLACLVVLDLLIPDYIFGLVSALLCHTFGSVEFGSDCYTCSAGVVVRLVMDV